MIVCLEYSLECVSMMVYFTTCGKAMNHLSILWTSYGHEKFVLIASPSAGNAPENEEAGNISYLSRCFALIPS